MAITPSQRPTREWPLLVLALALVCAICIPLWQLSLTQDGGEMPWARWTAQRVGQLLLGPEQIASYLCFTWAAFIILSRYLELRRQRAAFNMGLLPTEEGARILAEDARPLLRKLDQLTRGRPYILANMVRLALGKYAVSHQSQDVSETVRIQAEVDQGRLVSSLATVHYLAWAIPALGFVGTVRGLSGTLGLANKVDQDSFLDMASRNMMVAFDTTLVALVLSLVLMFWIHALQRDEESLVIDCQQFALEHLVNRLYQPEPTSGE